MKHTMGVSSSGRAQARPATSVRTFSLPCLTRVHGNGTAWTLVTPVNLQPEKTAGWQPMRITLVPGGSTSNFQVYNLFVDPRMR